MFENLAFVDRATFYRAGRDFRALAVTRRLARRRFLMFRPFGTSPVARLRLGGRVVPESARLPNTHGNETKIIRSGLTATAPPEVNAALADSDDHREAGTNMGKAPVFGLV